MELWIRSQDKETLMLAEHLDIYCSDEIEEIYCIEECGQYIGTYKTKERALEVLDEIQDILKPRNLIYTGDKIHMKDAAHLCKMTNSQSISLLPENANVTQLGVLVYEMPKE